MTNIHIKNAWHRIRRSPFQALAALFVLGTTFFVITILTVFIYSSTQVLKYFETRPQVIAFIKDEADQASVDILKDRLANDTRVAEVKYVSKEEALEIYKKATSDNPLLSELISPSIFPASVEVSLTNLTYAQEVIDLIQVDEVVDQVGFTASLEGESSLNRVIDRLKRIALYVRVGGGVFAGLLVSTSFLVLIIIIGMRITTKRGEIEILDLIGATPGFIRSPILIEALIYAVVGVIGGWLAGILLVLYATPSAIAYFGEVPILPKATADLVMLFMAILAGELLVGCLLGVFGSSIAVSRARKKSRKK